MTNLIGEFECKIDDKGRIILPMALKKQISQKAQDKFVINRGFEKHLVLYPMDAWKVIIEDVNRLNLYNRKNRNFVRYFYRGATELALDSSNRLLFPKSLLEYANISKDVILFAYTNRIEIWDKTAYEQLMTIEPEDFALLAEEVMDKPDNNELPEDVS
ncbi:MAG: division/cell wall cluster transcriptional repressor MraZ [Bacteroidota bacterium]|nr:division/cell wall cluster transcriptional repressor MraZ [Bacteroidota bacterium]